MLPDQLEELLRQWRYAHLGPPAPVRAANDDRTGPGSHPISRQREFALTKKHAQKHLAGRDGRGRRKLMALRSGVQNMRIVPTGFVDPIRCKQTRTAGSIGGSASVLPPDVQKIDRAAMDLYRFDKLKGLVLRFEYLGVGTQREKAEKVSEIMGTTLPLRMYRHHLDHARVWLSGRLAA